jgi:hypothetical protein
VTSARPAGAFPAGPSSTTDKLSRGSAFAAAGVLAALNAQANQIIGGINFDLPLESLVTLGGISAIIWAAMAAAWKIGAEDGHALAGARDWAVLAIAALLSFIPLPFAAQAGLLLCGGYLLVTGAPRSAQRRAAFVLLALTGPLIWGRILLHAYEVPILSLDARIVGAAIGTEVDGNVVRFAGDGSEFLVGAGCSSVHNMSLAILLWTTAAMLFKIRIDRGYVMIGGTMVALMFVLNILRLSAIGLFHDHFELLHVGAGAALFGWTGLIGAALLAGLGVTNAAVRQR